MAETDDDFNCYLLSLKQLLIEVKNYVDEIKMDGSACSYSCHNGRFVVIKFCFAKLTCLYEVYMECCNVYREGFYVVKNF